MTSPEHIQIHAINTRSKLCRPKLFAAHFLAAQISSDLATARRAGCRHRRQLLFSTQMTGHVIIRGLAVNPSTSCLARTSFICLQLTITMLFSLAENPQNCPSPLVHVISLCGPSGAPESTPQTESRSVHPFWHSSWFYPTDEHTDLETSVTTGRVFVLYACDAA